MTASNKLVTIVACMLVGQGGVALATVYDFSTSAGVDRFAYRNYFVQPPMPWRLARVPLGSAWKTARVLASRTISSKRAAGRPVRMGSPEIQAPQGLLVVMARLADFLTLPCGWLQLPQPQQQGKATYSM